MERNAGHNVDEQTGDLVKAMEDHRVPPHCYGNGIISESQTVGTDEKPFRLWEEPDRTHTEEVDEVAKIGEKVVVSALVVGVESNRHEIEELCCVPVMKILGVSSNQVSANEDVQNTTDKGDFLAKSDSLGIVPTSSESINTVAHLLPISIELLVRGRYSFSPLINNTLLCSRTSGLERISLFPHLLCLNMNIPLQLLQLLR